MIIGNFKINFNQTLTFTSFVVKHITSKIYNYLRLGLVKGALCTSIMPYITSSGNMVMNGELEGMWKEAVSTSVRRG